MGDSLRRLKEIAGAGRLGRSLRWNRGKKKLARDEIKRSNEKFLAKLDAMPDGLDRKARP